MSRATQHFQIIHGKVVNIVLKSNYSGKTSLVDFSFCYGYVKSYGINHSHLEAAYLVYLFLATKPRLKCWRF